MTLQFLNREGKARFFICNLRLRKVTQTYHHPLAIYEFFKWNLELTYEPTSGLHLDPHVSFLLTISNMGPVHTLGSPESTASYKAILQVVAAWPFGTARGQTEKALPSSGHSGCCCLPSPSLCKPLCPGRSWHTIPELWPSERKGRIALAVTTSVGPTMFQALF